MNASAKANHVLDQLPEGGLFAGHEWRIAPDPFPLNHELSHELMGLGRILHKFYQAADLLYRHSIIDKAPAWVAEYLEKGKPKYVIDLQRKEAFKNNLPRVIRPDILLTEDGWHITELDSVPGGIGLTAWLNNVYPSTLGGKNGMLEGFAGIFTKKGNKYIIVSEESKTYRPEMEWLAKNLNDKYTVRDSDFTDFSEGDTIYRFFELFDLPNVSAAEKIFNYASNKIINLTAPPKSYLEEKMLFALFWNRNLQEFWQRELGNKYFQLLKKVIPQTWIIDPTPIPPNATIPHLNLTNWNQLAELSQKNRRLILKLSGFNEKAWGARSVRFGADLSQSQWAEVVDKSISDFDKSPWILQEYKKPRLTEHDWYDFNTNTVATMKGRVRLCPYYFVNDEKDIKLGGVLATICPADKKIIHGMRDAILAPCSSK